MPNSPEIPSGVPEQGTQELERKKLVDQIVASDRQAFSNWLSQTEDKRNLLMPKEALRYLLIPQRILEIADRPENVDLVILFSDNKRVSALVVEHKPEPVTDPTKLAQYL